MRLGRHVDDRALLGVRIDLLDLGVALVRGVLGVDAAAADPAGGVAAVRPRFCVRAAVGLDGMPVRQVGVEQELQIGPQRGQLGAQRRNLVGLLGTQFGDQLTAQLRLHRQLVLPTRRDLPVQLQVVHEFQITHLGLITVALTAIDHRDEGGDHRGPQRENHCELEQFDPVGENQRRTRRDGQHQQHCHQDPTGPASAAPEPGAAGRIGHGATVPATGRLACRPGRRFGPRTDGFAQFGAGSASSAGSSGERQQCCSHNPATISASAHNAATTAPGVSSAATRSSDRRGSR